MSVLSMDLRVRIVEAYQNNEGSQREIATRFGVSVGVVCKLNQQWNDTGCLKPRTANNHGVRKVTAEVEQRLRERLQECPDATLEELRIHVGNVQAPSTIARNLKRMGLTNKKN